MPQRGNRIYNDDCLLLSLWCVQIEVGEFSVVVAFRAKSFMCCSSFPCIPCHICWQIISILWLFLNRQAIWICIWVLIWGEVSQSLSFSTEAVLWAFLTEHLFSLSFAFKTVLLVCTKIAAAGIEGSLWESDVKSFSVESFPSKFKDVNLSLRQMLPYSFSDKPAIVSKSQVRQKSVLCSELYAEMRCTTLVKVPSRRGSQSWSIWNT